MKNEIIKELSEKYKRNEAFIEALIDTTIYEGYNLENTKNIVETFLIKND